MLENVINSIPNAIHQNESQCVKYHRKRTLDPFYFWPNILCYVEFNLYNAHDDIDIKYIEI